VIPATDAPETLERCLEAVRGAREAPEEVVPVTEPPGNGPAAARNAGAAASDGEVLVFVDADVVVHPDAFVRIRSAFGADPALGAVFGAYDETPDAGGAVSGFRNLLHHQVHSEGSGEAETFWAGLGAVRREAFDAVGGFDAVRFPRPSIEDVELGIRLAGAGHRIRLDPAIQGTHLKRWTLTEMVRTDFAGRGVPWTRLLLEAGEPSSALNLSPRHRLGAALSMIVAGALALRRPRLALAGVLAMIGLNGRLYALIWRRRGPVEATLAVPLHIVHHLTAAAAAAAGLAAHLLGGKDARRGP
jgi:GT2 family glycosyltransferase